MAARSRHSANKNAGARTLASTPHISPHSLPAPPPATMDEPYSPSMIMEFATNSVRNTTVATADDDPYYEVVTRFWHPQLTKINHLDPASRIMTTVCEIDTKGKEARIRFLATGQEKEKDKQGEVQEMTKSGGGGLADGGIFIDSDGVEYRWKTHNRNFLLIRCGDDGRLPIVTFHPHKRHFGVWRMSKHASLEIKPNRIKNLVGLIASYLLVERQRRHRRF
ncbi:hypothetical protein B0H15DRAFT_906750 [Mycena belliarum]|uniref:DUF6593 domain-containing protein n=1 Tax=Mycena belliarum TaxID=1033014 RepID=A0AAD6U638_9AGAR|nr:hypothetical protein B0H15DRAFT_906750 [Mycena belliae]